MDFLAVLLDALHLVLRLTAPMLIACLLAAVLTSVLQAATQASDASLSFVPRWLAVAMALFLSGEFMARELVGFSTHMMQAMSRLGH